jgi:glycosyltransferase involved in cell wall biosynthesis
MRLFETKDRYRNRGKLGLELTSPVKDGYSYAVARLGEASSQSTNLPLRAADTEVTHQKHDRDMSLGSQLAGWVCLEFVHECGGAISSPMISLLIVDLVLRSTAIMGSRARPHHPLARGADVIRHVRWAIPLWTSLQLLRADTIPSPCIIGKIPFGMFLSRLVAFRPKPIYPYSTTKLHWGGLALIKVLHLITDLDRGGAEYCLKRLVERMDTRRFSSRIVSILPLGPLGKELRAEHIHVDTLDCETIGEIPRAFWQLRRIIRSSEPDIIQTWLYHADLLGTLASLLCTQSRLVWNIRNSDLSQEKRIDWQAITSLLALMSRLPDGIVSNSVAGIESHIKRGYRTPRWGHIPNGWNVEDCVPTAERRRKQREIYGLPTDDVLIGLVARRAQQKDFGSFLSAVALLHNRRPGLKFVLIGRDVSEGNQEFKDALTNISVQERLIFLGEQANVASLLPALDAVTLTSAYGEGMPNSIGEAMAAGLPVIATDVGDVRRLVIDGNWLVAPKSPEELASAWITLAGLEPDARAAIGERNRNWIEASYTIEHMSEQYEELYAQLMQPQPVAGLESALTQRIKPAADPIVREW